MRAQPFEEQVSGIAALDHALSRRVYAAVLEDDEASRDDVASALEIARSVAAFHLDKLAAAGLLTSRFERVSGRTGPGAGRPAKLYRRSDGEFELSLPPRSYDLAGAMLADAVSRAGADGTPVSSALTEAARGRGEQVAAEATHLGGADATTTVMAILRRHGFEPRASASSIALVNCPFHALAAEHTALVCGMNLDFLTGVISGLGAGDTLEARLAPEAGHCCVRIERT